MDRFRILFPAVAVMIGCSVGPVSAAPHSHAHRHPHYYLQPVPEPDDFVGPPVGFVFALHTARCEYPNGFSVSDFSRNVNGIPRGASELCAEGCCAYAPLSP